MSGDVAMAAGRVLGGRYRLVALIAKGGMAEVWEAADDVLTRAIAVKVLHLHLAADDEFRERFRREAVSAARLSHPNIVAIFDTGEDDGVAFIVMELVRGPTLKTWASEHGPLTPAAAVGIATQVADALAAAHAAGLVHRDVKPANILLDSTEEGRPNVKVGDFGIAQTADYDADLTQPGAAIGTVRYLAPEQIQGGELDGRADVYALGVVLYELLVGRPPFVADTAIATALAHVKAEPPRPRQLRSGIPKSVEAIVLRALAKDPADRYESAESMGLALRALDLAPDDAIASVVRETTPPGGVATFRQTERRWLVPAGLIIIAAVAVVVVGIAFSQSQVGHAIFHPGTQSAAPAGPIGVVAAHSFDPLGDGNENEARAGNAVDGNQDTDWATQHYTTRDFGQLKSGVGLRLELAATERIGRVRISSPTSGWSVQIYVADGSPATLADWGRPVTSRSDIAGSVDFTGLNARGQNVLIWITRLGDDKSVQIKEITLER